jgi:LysM repeat protein
MEYASSDEGSQLGDTSFDSQTERFIRTQDRPSRSPSALLAHSGDAFKPKFSSPADHESPSSDVHTEVMSTPDERSVRIDESPAFGEPLDPLPTPPSNCRWRRNDDGTYCIEHFNAETMETVVVEHTVMPCDTLQGICLRYKASVLDVRRLNYLSSNNIRSYVVLKVPVKPLEAITIQLNSIDVVEEKFRGKTGEPVLEAKYYLEDVNYDLNAALALWKEDDDWAKLTKTNESAHIPSTDPTSKKDFDISEKSTRDSTELLPRESLRRRIKGA